MNFIVNELPSTAQQPLPWPSSSPSHGIIDIPDTLYWDIPGLRILLKGNVELYKEAFRVACETDDFIGQIALANAYSCAAMGQDEVHQSDNREDYPYLSLSAHGFSPYIDLFKKSFIVEHFTDNEIENAAKTAYYFASERHFFPARLICLFQAARSFQINLPQLAAQLKPFADSGYPEAMLEYGKVIFFNKLVLPHLTDFSLQEGLSYMHASTLLTIKYPAAEMPYETFIRNELVSAQTPCSLFLPYGAAFFCPFTNIVICSNRYWISDQLQSL